jgi:hypothetical protein
MATTIIVHCDDTSTGIAMGVGRTAADADATAIVRYCEITTSRHDTEAYAELAADVAADIADGALILVRI